MKGVLYVSHGTRLKQGVKEAHNLIDKVKQHIPIPFQETCFLEITSPNIENGFKRLIHKGVNHVIVIPVLLLSAGHFYHDIPKVIHQLKKRFAHITITLGRPLGVQYRLVEILKERIEAISVSNPESAQFILVGRGSNYEETKQDMNEIKSMLKSLMGMSNVNVCYLAATEPKFEHILKQAIHEKHQEIIVIPYLWFSGLLTHYIHKTLHDTGYKGTLKRCHHLGDHPNMIDALRDSVLETIQKAEKEKQSRKDKHHVIVT